MSKWKSSTLMTIAALLIGVPLLVDHRLTERHRRQDLRDDELEREYECEPPQKCVADFNGDGMNDRVDVLAGGDYFYGWLITSDGGREILRLPYDYTDGTLRTHTAIRNEAGKSLLLVYDGASQRPPLKAVFAWDGERLVKVSPSELDSEILNAMAAHDDSGGWHERVDRSLIRIALLVGYYTLLTVVLGAVLYKWFRNPIGNLP